jgi:hypothetical protein
MNESDQTKLKDTSEENFVDAYANLGECTCNDEHRLHIALSQQRANPEIFAPEHRPIKGAYCAVHDRCRK